MRSLSHIFTILLIANVGWSQTLPMFRYHKPLPPFNLISTAPSFGYSLRNLSTTYNGFAVKIRRNSTGQPEANVDFDIADIVSGNSIVTVTKAGGGLTVGQTLTLTTFIGASQVFVVTWYDQGNPTFDATQPTAINQPRLVLNSAGTANDKPSILFDGVGTPAGGGDFLIINQPIQNIVDQGIRGTFMLALRPTNNSNHFTFGYRSAADWRWTFHINWSDGNFYFDSAEVCCAPNRSFANGANLNLWKQYSVVRGTSYKTVRISGITTGLNNSTAPSTIQAGGQFHIGSALNNPDATFSGNISELLMFPTDLTLGDIISVEKNQIAYWNL